MYQNYCTKCECEEYENLLEQCETIATDNCILLIAEQIMKYSDTERLMYEYGCKQKELLESICFNLVNDCTYTSIELA